MPENKKNLYYLDELSDYKVASEYCDVRGWDVLDADNRTIGKVDRLLVNKSTERVVYLDVEVDENLIETGHQTYQVPDSKGVHEFLNKDGDNHLIIPIGMANLDEKNKKVISTQIDYNTFTRANRFAKGTVIGHDYQLNIYRHYLGNNTMDYTIIDDMFYNRKEFENYWLNKNKYGV